MRHTWPGNLRQVCGYSRSDGSRRALSMVESLVSMLIISILIVVSLDLFGASAKASGGMNRQARGQLLAQGMMSEILQAAYREPSGLNILFGPELGEKDGTRMKFDDVDDYHNLNEPFPTRRDGTVIAGSAGWRWQVRVNYVQSDDLTVTSLTDQGIKRISVWVCWNAATCDGSNAMVTLIGVRTNAPLSDECIMAEKETGGTIITLPPIAK